MEHKAAEGVDGAGHPVKRARGARATTATAVSIFAATSHLLALASSLVLSSLKAAICCLYRSLLTGFVEPFISTIFFPFTCINKFVWAPDLLKFTPCSVGKN